MRNRDLERRGRSVAFQWRRERDTHTKREDAIRECTNFARPPISEISNVSLFPRRSPRAAFRPGGQIKVCLAFDALYQTKGCFLNEPKEIPKKSCSERAVGKKSALEFRVQG